jgi:hypothetical protein
MPFTMPSGSDFVGRIILGRERNGSAGGGQQEVDVFFCPSLCAFFQPWRPLLGYAIHA